MDRGQVDAGVNGLIIIFRIDTPYGCISLFIKYYFKTRKRLPKVGMLKGYLFSIKGI